MKVRVIGISGNTAAGKTTLALALKEKLNATYLCWDDFDEISKWPEDYVDWYKRGEHYEEFDYPALANTLEILKKQESVLHPTLHYPLNPSNIIIFDAPLGPLHQQTGKYIDFCIHVEVPLDILLARRIIRDFRNSDKSKEMLIAELEYYLEDSRPLYFDDALKEAADLVIDGLLDTEAQVLKVLDAMETLL